MMAYAPAPVTTQPVHDIDSSLPVLSQQQQQQPQRDTVTIRNMAQEDSDFAGRMTVESFRGKFEWFLSSQKMASMIQAMQEDHRGMAHQYHRIHIAEYNGHRAGLLALSFHRDGGFKSQHEVDYQRYLGCWSSLRLTCFAALVGDEDVPVGYAYVDHICVDEGFRGKGIGKVLLEKADNEARAWGCHTIFLYVATTNPARRLYERQGYVITSTDDYCCLTWCAMGIRKFHKMEKRL